MPRFAFIAGLLLATLPLATCGAGADSAATAEAPLSRVVATVHTADGQAHRYTVEVARTPQQQSRGLMFRTQLPRDQGMLFPMDPPRLASFWMQDTLIPLDMIFIAEGGIVESITPEAEPQTTTPRTSFGPVVAVLELAGGEAARIGLKVGDRVEWAEPGRN